MNPKLIAVLDTAKAKAAEAQHGAAEIYAQHGHHVRAAANVGIYVAGAVIASTATTTVVKAVGVTVGFLGLIGIVGSAAEYAGRGWNRQAVRS
jgi:hypothetical protein